MESRQTFAEAPRFRVSTFVDRVSTGVRLIASLVVLTIASLVMFLAALGTAFRLRRFYTEYLARWLGRTVLWIWNVKTQLHTSQPLPESPSIYVSNHPSTLDIFVLISLGLPNTRYLMSGFLRYFFPLGLIGYTIGIFFTPRQKYPDRRAVCFRNVCRELGSSRESVYVSPEGRRRPDGLGPFNKGAFHLATELGFPIVPIYLYVPDEISPGTGFVARAGTVDVYVKPPIATVHWKLDELDENRDRVRDLFLQWEAELHPQRGRHESIRGADS